MIPFELAQTLIVTATAGLAATVILRRMIGRKKRQAQAPGCASCPSGAKMPAPRRPGL